MKVTTKGQVTIPKAVRDQLGIKVPSEVEFIEEKGRIYLVKSEPGLKKKRFVAIRGTSTQRMSTDEIMQLTRGEG
jgi:AbrB family looped-hinge helix DNA binding protein